MLKERLQQESQRLKEKITSLEEEISHLPEGNFYCIHNNKYIQWFRNINGKHVYISKRNRTLAERLAYKKYLTLQLKDCLQKQQAADAYLKYSDSSTEDDLQTFLSNPDYQELLSPVFAINSGKFQDWMTEPFEKNPTHPEQLIFRTASGNLVRSKSEVLIDMYLHLNKIPFRYECALNLGYTTLYPDFTILHPDSGELFYWEHFGMMDDPAYSKHAFSKLQLYANNQIVPGIQLITTYETRQRPLSPETVEKTIQQFFL